jgi:hypothetical protein
MTTSNFVQANGPPLKQLGLKKVAPSEVVVRQIPALVFASPATQTQWANSMDATNLIAIGSSVYNSNGYPGLEELRSAAAAVNAQFVYTNTRFMGRNTKSVSVPILSTSGRTVTTNSNNFGSFNYYGNSYGRGSYRGYGTSSTYIPGTTVYAPKQVEYDVYRNFVIFCVPSENMSAKGRQRLTEFQRTTNNN